MTIHTQVKHNVISDVPKALQKTKDTEEVDVVHQVLALGKEISYSPSKVMYDLCQIHHNSDPVSMVIELYADLGHHIETSQAKGCLQQLKAGKAVPNIILQAWMAIH